MRKEQHHVRRMVATEKNIKAMGEE